MIHDPPPPRPEPADGPPRRPGPPHYPVSRIGEAREIATEAGWPVACPDPKCRDGRCAGRLRSVGGGPATFTTCLAIVARWHEDPGGLTLREADAMLHFLRPGGGWTMQPTPLDGEAGWPVPDAAHDAIGRYDILVAAVPLHLGHLGGDGMLPGG